MQNQTWDGQRQRRRRHAKTKPERSRSGRVEGMPNQTCEVQRRRRRKAKPNLKRSGGEEEGNAKPNLRGPEAKKKKKECQTKPERSRSEEEGMPNQTRGERRRCWSEGTCLHTAPRLSPLERKNTYWVSGALGIQQVSNYIVRKFDTNLNLVVHFHTQKYWFPNVFYI